MGCFVTIVVRLREFTTILLNEERTIAGRVIVVYVWCFTQPVIA